MSDFRSHAFSMFLAAAIFAVLGYYMYSWTYQTATPAMIELLKWTLRIGAFVFAIAGVGTVLRLVTGLALFGASALSAAAVLLLVALWEMQSTYHSGPGPLVLIVFAAWCGYTGFEASRRALAEMRHGPAIAE